MRLKKISALFVVLFIFTMICGCGRESDKVANKFVASCYPVYIIAKNLARDVDDVQVCKMSENQSGCLHHFQLQSTDMKNIEQSAAFIINGAGMEDSFLGKVTDEAPNLKIIDSSKGIELIEGDCHCDECEDCHECDDCHEEFNSHIWVSPENCIIQIKNVAEGLKEIDSKNAEKYQKNCDEYVEKIVNLKNKMHSELKGISKKNIITFHDSFPYFAKEFDLNIVGVVNHESDEESSAKELAEVIELVKNNDVSAVFTEPQYSGVSASMISNETGVKVCSLDPAVTGDESLDSYIEIMEKNIKTLKEALLQ